MLIDERNDPSDYECVVVSEGYGIEFYKQGRALNVNFGDLEGSEMLGDEDSVYVTEALHDDLWGEGQPEWKPIL